MRSTKPTNCFFGLNCRLQHKWNGPGKSTNYNFISIMGTKFWTDHHRHKRSFPLQTSKHQLRFASSDEQIRQDREDRHSEHKAEKQVPCTWSNLNHEGYHTASPSHSRSIHLSWQMLHRVRLHRRPVSTIAHDVSLSSTEDAGYCQVHPNQ